MPTFIGHTALLINISITGVLYLESPSNFTLFSHTVRHEYSLVEQQLGSVEQLNKATCRVLSSQIAGYVRNGKG